MNTSGTQLINAFRRNHWVNHVRRHAAMRPNDVAFRFQGQSTTWAEFHARVERLANALAGRGIQAGARVAVLTGNRPEFLEVVLAANLIGAIAVPINHRLSAHEVAYIVEDSAATLLFSDSLTTTIAAEAVRLVKAPLAVVDIGEADSAYEDLVGSDPRSSPLVDVPENADALIMYTSGTTGRPKGAVLTHQNLQAQALTVTRAFELTSSDDVNLVASPLFHIGAIGSVVALLLTGGTIVIAPSTAFNACETLDVLAVEGVTTVFLVPTQWRAICDEALARRRDLPALRIMSWGAAPATDKLLRDMSAAFPMAMNVAVFGQTEMSPITCVLEGHHALDKLGSVGRPVATVQARIVDHDMNDVPSGAVGEIVYRGPTVMSRYWRNDKATAEAFRGGWFHSGDLVREDADGFIYVVDRAKDMIITGGENVYCAEVENVLAEHPAIAEVAIVAEPHQKWGETPVAVINWASGHPPIDISELREWASQRLANFKLPTRIHALALLPRNASGKVIKHELRVHVSASVDRRAEKE